MQCVTDLAKLRASILSRSSYLRQIMLPMTTTLSAQDRRALAYVAIELDNMVVFGLRQYTKSSLLRSRTAAGVRINASVMPKSTGEAAALIFKSLNPAGYTKAKNPVQLDERDEIVFRDPKKTERVFIDYSVSNLTQLTLGLSLNADVFVELKTVRHFFAHRCRNTFEAVQTFASNLGVLNVESPEHLVTRGRPSTGVRIIDGWLSDVENFFDLAS